ncbi:ELMO/CED-12 family protein [Zea mays]|uniref:ELMO/CED-12 family protein n=1 Tax=Zea mays TaxID=4577 RepID=A0A1D6E4C7_MAIZE|nr:ELMO/CED-12 family protein [Zea mays]
MEQNDGSFLAVRRLSGGAIHHHRHHSSPAEVVGVSTAWIGKGLTSCVCAQGTESDGRLSFDLSPIQEECLHRLQNRIEVQYDGSNLEHQKALVALWHASFPGTELLGLVSDQWKEMGWQGKDPSTDFRSGIPSLQHLQLSIHLIYFECAIICSSGLTGVVVLYLWRIYCISLRNIHEPLSLQKSFHELLRKQNGDRALWEYPFAVAGVNITFMLIQMLDLQAAKPTSLVGAVFLNLLLENDRAFDILYCITFKLMDQKWLEMHASYMDFNVVIKSTRRQLERELLLEDIQRIQDMPSYMLLTC